MKYQYHYSENFPKVTDEGGRIRKATKIVRILEDFLGQGVSGLACLDIGCSVGIITRSLISIAGLAVGFDIDEEGVRRAAQGAVEGTAFLLADASAAPFAPGSFDVIVCSQVYEHTPDFPALIAEIHRLLRAGGVCFFSGPNRWAVWERHYNLPFLSWLPRRLANHYVRIARRGYEYYEHPRSAGELRRALKMFTIHDYAPRLLSDPERFAMEDDLGAFKNLVARLPMGTWRILDLWVPNFNWVLVKDG